MSGSDGASQGLDERRRRIRYRAWRRGTREMDMILGPFADACLPILSDEELAQFEALIDVPDRDLFAWLTGADPTPDAHDGALWRRLREFHDHPKPLHAR